MTKQFSARAYVHSKLLDELDLRQMTHQDFERKALEKKLRLLIPNLLRQHDDFTQWQDDQALIQSAIDEILGLGPIEPFLRDHSVSEIMVNGPSTIFIERAGKIVPTQAQFVSEDSLRNMISRVLSPIGRRIDEASPMVDARLHDGSRFNAVVAPLAVDGTSVTIRKFSKTCLLMKDLIAKGAVSAPAACFLKSLVLMKKNILIAGGTGTGKTTLLNIMASFIPKQERLITIEDAAELSIARKHLVRLEARPSNAEGKGEIAIKSLLRNALRMRPNRIVVGECRGPEVVDMLSAMNTGHEGSMSTVHANSARDSLLRLETMFMTSGLGLPSLAIRENVASALDFIVFLARSAEGQRYIDHIEEISGMENGTILSARIFDSNRQNKQATWTGIRPKNFDEHPHHKEIFEKIFKPVDHAA